MKNELAQTMQNIVLMKSDEEEFNVCLDNQFSKYTYRLLDKPQRPVDSRDGAVLRLKLYKEDEPILSFTAIGNLHEVNGEYYIKINELTLIDF